MSTENEKPKTASYGSGIETTYNVSIKGQPFISHETITQLIKLKKDQNGEVTIRRLPKDPNP